MTDTTTRPRRRAALRAAVTAVVAGASLVATGGVASAAGYPSDDTPPDLISALSGYDSAWQPSGANDLHGTVKDAATLQWDDRLTSWINQNATKDQQFRALQNSAYKGADGSGYDQSISIADGLGGQLGRIYAQGRVEGKLPKVDALISSENGTAGAYVGTGEAKKRFSHPRPFLPASADSKPVAGDEDACAPSKINGSSVTPNRLGKAWANPDGSLKITRLAPVVDTTHDFASSDVTLDAGYGSAGLCTGGSYPSGHTTTAYQAGITLLPDKSCHAESCHPLSPPRTRRRVRPRPPRRTHHHRPTRDDRRHPGPDRDHPTPRATPALPPGRLPHPRRRPVRRPGLDCCVEPTDRRPSPPDPSPREIVDQPSHAPPGPGTPGSPVPPPGRSRSLPAHPADPLRRTPRHSDRRHPDRDTRHPRQR
ncbi:MAG: hypothetical protein LKI24_15395 [Acidipropionibacterium sp.]|nr:hypothetical protein [Acidipropionibacterium sp.]